jgi:hypothetical protein
LTPVMHHDNMSIYTILREETKDGSDVMKRQKKKETKREAEHTEGVDDGFVFLRYVVRAADPLAAIAQCPDALDEMRAPEGRDEKVPWREKCPYGEFQGEYASSTTRETSTTVVVGRT